MHNLNSTDQEVDDWVISLLEDLDKGEGDRQDIVKVWFAEAVRRGHMFEAAKHLAEIESWENDSIRLAEYIDKHLKKHNKMPCRVNEMTPREHELFKMLAAHNGLLMFLAEYLDKKGQQSLADNET